MTHRIRFIYLALFFCLLPHIAIAQGPGAPPPGLSGKLQAGGFIMQTDSQLSTEGTNRRTDDLDGPADSHQLISGLASLYLRY